MPTAQSHLLDLSHDIEHGMVTYRGLPPPRVCDYLSREQSRHHYAEGTEFQIDRIEMVGNTGTYLDSPCHRYADGKDLSELPLESLADLDTVVVRADRRRGAMIDVSAFEGLDVADKAVLVHTGWSAHWRRDAYADDHPFLTEGAARLLLDRGARLVGIDSYNIDDTNGPDRPVHSLLLGNEVPIVEHLTNLDAVPDRGARFFAVPVKIRRFGTFPVRAFCRLSGAR